MDRYSKFFPFAYRSIDRVNSEAFGIYEIYCQTTCLYVGMAKEQTIRERLFQHYNDCHNDFLKLWIKSSYKLRFRIFTVQDHQRIPTLESEKIRHLAPLCNKDRRYTDAI